MNIGKIHKKSAQQATPVAHHSTISDRSPVPLRRTLDKSEKMRYNIPTKLIEIRML